MFRAQTNRALYNDVQQCNLQGGQTPTDFFVVVANYAMKSLMQRIKFAVISHNMD
jgi:hypothetical protein